MSHPCIISSSYCHRTTVPCHGRPPPPIRTPFRHAWHAPSKREAVVLQGLKVPQNAMLHKICNLHLQH